MPINHCSEEATDDCDDCKQRNQNAAEFTHHSPLVALAEAELRGDDVEAQQAQLAEVTLIHQPLPST